MTDETRAEKSAEEIIKLEEKSSIFVSIISMIAILLVLLLLCYSAYYEYQSIKEMKDLIRENNGTCIRKGLNIECSYAEEPVCYRNNARINCSEIEQ